MPDAQTGDPLGYLDELRLAIESPDLGMMLHGLGPFSPLLWGSPEEQPVAETEPFPPTDNLRDHELWELRHYFREQSGWNHLKEMCRYSYFTEAAYAVHRYHGYCRLYGISLPEDLRRLLTKHLLLFLSVPASAELLRILKHTAACAERLPAQFDQGQPFEDMGHCTAILHLLMQTWATATSFEEAFRFYVERTGDIDSKLGRQYDKILDAFHSLDSTLQSEEHLKLLSVAVELPLLENWRLMLADPFREELPWWLDGRLEETAHAIEKEMQNPSAPGGPGAAPRTRSDYPPTLRLERKGILAEYEERRSRLAADPGFSADARRLLDNISHSEYAVESDPDVAVLLELDTNEAGQPISLGLKIVPRAGRGSLAEVIARYLEARITGSGAESPVVVPLRLGYGTFTPPDAIRDRPVLWAVEIEIDLIDRSGGSHRVVQD